MMVFDLIMFDGSICRIAYPRRWYHLWKSGYRRHIDGLGRPCWIKEI